MSMANKFMPLGLGLGIAAFPFALGLALKAHADPVITGGIYMETVSRACEARKVCVARFSAIPSPGTIVKMENLSCKWSSVEPLRRVEVSIVRGLRSLGDRYVGADEFDQSSRTLNAPLHGITIPMAFQPGTVPEVSFVLRNASDVEFTCTLAGKTG